MMNDQDFKNYNYNILGANSKVTGDLTLSGDSIVNSHIEGNIFVKDGGKLVLERGSFIKGKIKAIDLEVFGTIEGEVECEGLLSIRSSGKVSGIIKSGKLVIYPGAEVEMKASTEENT